MDFHKPNNFRGMVVAPRTHRTHYLWVLDEPTSQAAVGNRILNVPTRLITPDKDEFLLRDKPVHIVETERWMSTKDKDGRRKLCTAPGKDGPIAKLKMQPMHGFTYVNQIGDLFENRTHAAEFDECLHKGKYAVPQNYGKSEVLTMIQNFYDLLKAGGNKIEVNRLPPGTSIPIFVLPDNQPIYFHQTDGGSKDIAYFLTPAGVFYFTSRKLWQTVLTEFFMPPRRLDDRTLYELTGRLVA